MNRLLERGGITLPAVLRPLHPCDYMITWINAAPGWPAELPAGTTFGWVAFAKTEASPPKAFFDYVRDMG